MIDFYSLKTPGKPNHFLACDEEACPHAIVGMPAPAFNASLADVARAWDVVIRNEPRLEETARSADGWQREYVQRSAVFRFPDRISVRFVAEPEATEGSPSTRVLVYSIAEKGYYDFGVNRKRVERWLGALKRQLALKKPE